MSTNKVCPLSKILGHSILCEEDCQAYDELTRKCRLVEAFVQEKK